MSSLITSRDFNQHVNDAKRATASGPVFITHRGKPSHVLLRIEDYERLTGTSKTLLEAVAQSEGADFDFQVTPAKLTLRSAKLG